MRIGSDLQFFSCYQVSSTQFIQLKDVEEGAGKVPPPVLVLHGHFGGSVGDHRRYDAFTLGGPYSLRGYNRSRISAARSILEVCTCSFHVIIGLNTTSSSIILLICL